MPLVRPSNYKAPSILRNPHFNTIYAALFRKVELDYERERIFTTDGDFIDLDWAVIGSDKLIIAIHGLEGHSGRPYIKGMLRYFGQKGWDGLGMNLRGCSGELNHRLETYHMGATDDLETVIQHVLEQDRYRQIVIAGFSLGGNIVLKYLGERGSDLHPALKAGLTFSVPCEVLTSNVEINRRQNRIYLKRFLKTMNQKILEKGEIIPDFDPLPEGRLPENFYEFDNWYTAPINGFKDAEDYWRKTSSLRFLPNINLPCLLISAKDDTFLSPQSYPYNQAEANDSLYFENPSRGGHIGFVEWKENGAYYTDRRAWEFVKELV
ncbi:MAG: alpha/beta fold hydrolase [Bacteroidetes bacterium]|nr:alpha/beta fold hydrolase [Bacteroidota bacterium]